MRGHEITSADNPLVKEFRRLLKSRKYRCNTGKLALEGPRLVQEALAAGLIPQAVFYTGGYLDGGAGGWLSGLPAETQRCIVPPAIFSRLTETETPQAVAAIVPFHEPEASILPDIPLSLVLLLDRLQDPGNMGTILRTAAAAGVDAVFYTPGSVDPYSPKVLRSTAGAVFHLAPSAARQPLELLTQLMERGLQVVAAAPGAELNCWEPDYRKASAVIIGSESSGLSADLEAAADSVVSIPRARPLDSLNAAVAAAIILYEAVRQRHSSVATLDTYEPT